MHAHMDRSERLHIALVSTEFPPAYGGGIGTCVGILAAALAQRGHEVTVVTPAPDADAVTEEPTGTGTLRVARLAHSPRPADADPVRTLESWWSWSARAAAHLRELRPHIAEFPDYRAEAIAAVADPDPAPFATAIRLHTPLTVLARCNAARARYRILEMLEIEALLAADGVISSSHPLTERVLATVPDLGPVEFAPYGIDPALLAAPPAPLPANARDVVYVGRIEERKGVEVLARAAAAFLDEAPEAVLHFVGGDTEYGPGEPSTRRIVERLIDPRHRDRVVFHGSLPPAAVRERIAQARLCVFPSLFEAGPYTCLEAMALARPVVGTNGGGMAHMIEDGVTGLLCPPGDADALARALATLFNTPDDRLAAMGAAGRERVAAHFSADAAAAATEAAYRRIIARRREPRPSRRAPELGMLLASREAREGNMSRRLAETSAECERLAIGWRRQTDRVHELDAHVARIWDELQTVASARDQWHAEAQRLARGWDELDAQLKSIRAEAARLSSDLLATQSDRAALMDRLSRLERAVAETQRRPVFRILARAGLVRPIPNGHAFGGWR